MVDSQRNQPAESRRSGGSPATVHEAFALRARICPDAVAVETCDEQWTYRALEAAAGEIAGGLRAEGGGPGTAIGLYLDRSPRLLASMLGVLKAGGAYVPFDASYPPARLAAMLSDSAISIVLTEGGLGSRLPAGSSRIVDLDEDWPRRESETPAPPPAVSAGALAYVMFTSGSTGRPKGVAIPHRAILRLVTGCTFAELGSSEIFFQYAPVAFDASTFEVWGCLLHGGRLVLPQPGALSPDQLATRLRERRITTLWLTAGLFQQMVSLRPDGLAGLRQLLAGGDALPVESVRRTLAELPDVRLINGYGPTECTTFACCHTLTEEDLSAGSVPIGGTIQRTEALLLDPEGTAVEPGRSGELVLGGDGLAQGYYRRPALTAERFVPHPSGRLPGSRLYRTGDLARRRPDGVFEFLGRVDRQVKIRGFRIEPGEIQAAIDSHSAVSQSIVVAWGHGAVEKRLVAYVVPAREGALAQRDLLDFLGDLLPECMLPATVVFLDALPLDPNGKVDRRALPVPEHERAELSASYRLPRTPTEEILAGLWSEVLGWAEVGIDDDFFELGGHSLLAGRLMTRVREVFACELPLTTIFEAPTVALQAIRLADAVAGGTVDSEGDLEPGERTADLRIPLSLSQERIWFLSKLDPTSLAYNFQAVIRFTGELSVPALEVSLETLVRRHEILRTTVVEEEGKAYQKIHPPTPLRLPVLDLRDLGAERETSEIDRQLGRLFRWRFDLGSLPLIRWILLRLTGNRHLLVHVEHHLVHDGWSFNRWLDELFASYREISAGRRPELPALGVQFADFALWQQRRLAGQALQGQLDYWLRQLEGAPATTTFPSDRPRPRRAGWRGAAPRQQLTVTRLRSLRCFSREQGATLFMTMTAAFMALVHRHNGQPDLCIGTGVANRRSQRTGLLLGMIVNNVVLRSRPAADPTFRDHLDEVRHVALEAYANQDYPFDKLVEALAPARDPGHNPLFQLMFNFHDAARPAASFPGLEVQVEEGLSNRSAKFDLNLIVLARAEQEQLGRDRLTSSAPSTIIWEYSTELYEAASIERLMEQYGNLLDDLVRNPQRRLSELDLLGAAGREQLLVAWNRTATDYPRECTVHELFGVQAKRSPDAVAVAGPDGFLSYGDLDQRSERLAQHLRAAGVGPEVSVGLLLERSPELMLAMLATLKAGGAYVPLDPDYPRERLNFLVNDAKCAVTLTRGHLAASLGPRVGSFSSSLLNLDCMDLRVAPRTAGTLPAAVAENLAYVIYTSGSTGQPKGVTVTHRGIVRLVCETNYVELDELDVVAQLSTAAFDAATFEMWGALLRGARLQILPRDISLSPGQLANELARTRVTTLFLTTALFNQMAREVPGTFSGLRHLLFGGEQVDPSCVREVLVNGPPQRLLHVYGPTESTTFATWTEVASVAPEAATVAIGRPVANTTGYVVDGRLRPSPPGGVGELLLGGDGLARGYLCRPRQTAEKFVPSPFGMPGERLYRTADLVRLDADDEIVFFGRNDRQLKIRGFRVEPGEIESRLAAHSAVREAAVVALPLDETTRDLRLVAYVATRDRRHLESPAAFAGDLRRDLLASLPSYMVPATYEVLSALPLTPTGKIDRRALPEPRGLRPELETAFRAPRTATEETLAAAWCRVLGVDRVGVHDNFFELGGHSLLLVRLHGELQPIFGERLSIIDLFTYPTIAALGQHLRPSGRGDLPEDESLDDERIAKLALGSRRVALQLRHAQGQKA